MGARLSRCISTSQRTQARTKRHIASRLFYDSWPAAKPFVKRLVLSPDELRSVFVVQTRLFASLSPTESGHIRSCYPRYDFRSILYLGLRTIVQIVRRRHFVVGRPQTMKFSLMAHHRLFIIVETLMRIIAKLSSPRYDERCPEMRRL